MTSELTDLSPRASSLIGRLFLADEAGDKNQFLAQLTKDVELRMGSGPVLRGRWLVGKALSAFYTVIDRVEHKLVNAWERGDTLTYEAEATFVYRLGPPVTVPYINVIEFEGALVKRYLVYFDPIKVIAAPAAIGLAALFGAGVLMGWKLARRRE
jgi:ketosteroid isomerase-like protein